MYYAYIVAALISAWSVDAAAEAPRKNQVINYTDRKILNVANAAADARRAIDENDLRLYAVYGYTLEVPGFEGPVKSLPKKYGIRIIEGTSDAFKNSKDKELNDNARAYAAKYNATLIAETKDRTRERSAYP